MLKKEKLQEEILSIAKDMIMDYKVYDYAGLNDHMKVSCLSVLSQSLLI